MELALSYDCPHFRGKCESSATKHLPPTTQPAVQQQWSTQPTTAAPYAPQRSTCRTPGAEWNLYFLTILYLPRERASRPPETLFMAPTRGVAVVLPGTPRADVWGGRVPGVRSLGSGWRAAERRV